MPELDVDRAYRQHRRSAYTGIFVGYASYYLVRNTLALAIPTSSRSTRSTRRPTSAGR
jgi:OPA family glycerol-3-phosphate transporter-like MFS transporter